MQKLNSETRGRPRIYATKAQAEKAKREKSKRFYLKTRRALLLLLGGKCKCGFTDERALQIDHRNGGGMHEIRSMGWRAYYAKVSADPTNYQILCANCNWIKRHEKNENPKPRT
jgi:hypothetical protein